MEYSAIKAIKSRRSVRTYDKVEIREEELKVINEFLKDESQIKGPFGSMVSLKLFNLEGNITEGGQKIGTYGVIKGAKAFLAGTSKKDKEAIIDYGYVFERLVLLLTSMGLGTCWLAGTFSRSSFAKELKLNESEIIPAVSPVGYFGEKKSMLESFMRFAAKSDNRKPWEELFFFKSFDKALSKEMARELEVPLEMVRIGPSASNKQPWRIVVSEDKSALHLLFAKTPGYADFQLLDIGIAMCHLEQSCRELGVSGGWTKLDHGISVTETSIEYIVSWKR